MAKLFERNENGIGLKKSFFTSIWFVILVGAIVFALAAWYRGCEDKKSERDYKNRGLDPNERIK